MAQTDARRSRTEIEAVYDPELRLYVADETCDSIDYAPDGTIENRAA
jgi:hypothetical protein